jgi:hypothetical protein
MKILNKNEQKNIMGGRKPAPREKCCIKWETPGTECLAYSYCDFE